MPPLRISAIVPAYNCRQQIHAALDSIFAQTLPTVEVIVVDDGSTDGTGEYLRDVFGSKIVYRQQPNQGPSAARNHGVRLARGEWIAFLDADDCWLPEKLERQAAMAAAVPGAAVVASDFLIRNRVSDAALHRRLVRPFTRESVREYAKKGNPISPCTAMIRREVFLRLGGFDTRYRCGEDREFWARLVLEYDIAAVLEPLVMVNERPESVSSDPATVLRDGPAVNRRVAELLRSASWTGRIRDRALLARADSRMFVSAAILYLQRNDHRAALAAVAHSFLLWPFGGFGAQWLRLRMFARSLFGGRAA